MKFAGKTILAAFFAVMAASVYALPGFKPYIADQPGVYVYYRDDTFRRRSYTGFLAYDDGTYAARYYAPADGKQKLPEKSVAIFFTLDPAADHIELTGEKIVPSLAPDSGEIINYLHDMVYELNARRIKAGEINPETVKKSAGNDFADSGFEVYDDFVQFGGNVKVIYDYLVPLFNIKKIESPDGHSVFEIVTAGVLRSADDRSFDSFRGFPEKYSDSSHKFAKPRKLRTETQETEDGQQIVLDSLWSRPMDNLWLCGDAAVLSLGQIPASGGDFPQEYILRQMLMSAQDSYIDWKALKLENADGKYKIESIFYQPANGSVSRNFKIMADSGNEGFFVLTLTVFDNIYQKNRRYFDDIIKSYAFRGKEN